MRPLRVVLALVLTLAALPAAAECYADYKAKKDDPLRLHYGVMEISDRACNGGGADREVAQRLRDAGWTLLGVLSVFGRDGLEERKADAGDFFLRY